MNTINQHTRIYIGKDSLEHLKNINNSKIFIVVDAFLVKNKMIDRILYNIDSSNKVKIFDEVKPDPSLEIVSKATAIMTEFKAEHIIGFGGGSAIDTAKGVIYFLKTSNEAKDNINFIAIPTTSGTGSEVTSVSVVTDEEKQVKHLLSSNEILPDEALLDATFTLTVPPNIVANTGLDVFTHIIEAYVAKCANDFSDAYAEKSGQLLVKYLYESYSDKDSFVAKEKMHIASNLAGTAFNIAGLGLNHSIAHQIGGVFHIPHGLANAILLNYVIDFNCKSDIARKRYADFARKIGIVEIYKSDDFAIRLLKSYITTLMKLLDMPLKISDCNIDKIAWDKNKALMARNALEDNCMKYTPVAASEKDISKILDEIY